jgi:hypothetical protein
MCPRRANVDENWPSVFVKMRKVRQYGYDVETKFTWARDTDLFGIDFFNFDPDNREIRNITRQRNGVRFVLVRVKAKGPRR